MGCDLGWDGVWYECGSEREEEKYVDRKGKGVQSRGGEGNIERDE